MNVSVLFLVVPRALPVFIAAAAEPVYSPQRAAEAHQRIRCYIAKPLSRLTTQASMDLQDWEFRTRE